MKREELELLGLQKEQIDAIMDINGKDVTNVRVKLEGALAQVTAAATTIAERDAQLENLKNSTGDIEALKLEVTKLQGENQVATEKHTKELAEMKLNSAIKLLLTGKVHDENLAAGQFDRSKMILNEDGTVTGLQDQLVTIQKEKAFLFKGEEPKGKETGFKFGVDKGTDQAGAADKALDAAFGLESK